MKIIASAPVKIMALVERVTREGSSDFVPVSERIATFDNDGTLWCEQPVYVQVPTVELGYSIWNVLSLGLVVCLLTVSGMMMMDMMFNMWSFSGTTSVTTGFMDSILSILNMS